ncbi:MAG: hypothetical protein K0S07_1681, partial [Chlamydiales bacterium]|nr:hypothetical protein [Chlamydiales bacterium]
MEQVPVENFFIDEAFCEALYLSLAKKSALNGHLLFEELLFLKGGEERQHLLGVQKLVRELIDDAGLLRADALEESILRLQTDLFALQKVSLGVRRRHLLERLSLLQKDGECQRALLAIQPPVSNRLAENYMREALGSFDAAPLKVEDARRAVLACWLTYFRQTVGSCFATAPALVIHNENPLYFFKDMQELLDKGRLTR